MISARDAGLFRALCKKEYWQRYSPQIVRLIWKGNTDLQMLYGYMKDLHETTPNDYTPTDLSSYIESVVRDERLGGLKSTVEAMLASQENPDPLVLQRAVAQFAARSYAHRAAQEIARTHDKPDFDPATSLELLQQSVEVLHPDTSDKVLSYLKSELPNDEHDRPGKCRTGISEKIDYGLAGGAAAGEFVVFLAGAKKGKTTLLSHIGNNNAKRGAHVLHVSLEVSKEMTRARYDSASTGMAYEDLCVNPAMVRRVREQMRAAGGDVKFVDWQYEEHSPSELIPIVKQFGPFDLLILDYLELMIPDQTKAYARREQRHLLSKLGKDLRGVLRHLNLPCYTAWQTNREGNTKDTVSEHDVSECWDIMKHADFVFGLSQTATEKQNHVLRLHTLLSRFRGTPVSQRFHADLERNVLREII